MRKEQVYAVELAQAFTADINVERGGVNSGITAAVRNVRSSHCGVNGGVQQANCCSLGPNPCQKEDEVDAEGVSFDGDALVVHQTLFTSPVFCPCFLKGFVYKESHFRGPRNYVFTLVLGLIDCHSIESFN